MTSPIIAERSFASVNMSLNLKFLWVKFKAQFEFPTNGGRPLWWWLGLATLCLQGSEWPSTSRVILWCQWHSTILTKNNCTILFWLLSSHLHRFQVIELFMFRPPLLILFMCSYSDQQCCVKDVSSIFNFEIDGSHPTEGATHIRVLLVKIMSLWSIVWPPTYVSAPSAQLTCKYLVLDIISLAFKLFHWSSAADDLKSKFTWIENYISGYDVAIFPAF